MSDEIYAGKIKSITGKIQVTENHGTNTEKRAARMEDLTALSAGVVHKTINEDKTEAVKISGNLETTNQISAKTVIANDSISVSNTKLKSAGFETDGSLTAAGNATIGGDVEIGGKLTVKGQDVSGTTDQSLAIVAPTVEVAVKKDEETSIPVIVATATSEGTQTEIKADTVKTAASKEVEISAAEVITEASSKSTIIAPEIWLKDLSDKSGNYIKVNNTEGITAETASIIKLKANDNTYVQLNNDKNEVILTATTISLDSAATNTTASLSYDTEEFKTVKSHTEGDSLSTTNVPYRIVNNKALRSYNKAVDAKITTTKNDLKGLIDGNTTNITKINSALGTYGNLDSGNSHTVWGEIKAIQDNISNGLHFRGVFTDKNNVDNPKPGDLIIIGTQEYVYNGTTWQELGDEDAHATKDDLAGEVAELVKADKDLEKAYESADASLKSELEGKINGKFDALKGRVDGHDAAIAGKLDSSVHTKFVEDQAILDAGQDARIKAVEDSLKADGDTYKAIAAKLESSVYDTHITAYNTKVEALEAKDTEFAGKISAIETSLSTGDIHTEIDGVRTLAQKGVDDAVTVSDRVTTLENKLPSQYKLDTGLFGELETDTEGNLTGALIIRTVQKQAAAVNGINNNEVY